MNLGAQHPGVGARVLLEGKKKAKCSNKLSFFPHRAVGSPWLLRTCTKKEAVPWGWYPARQGGVGKQPPKSHSCFFSSYSAALPPYPTTFRVLVLLALLVAVPSCSSLGPWLYSLRPSLAAPQGLQLGPTRISPSQASPRRVGGFRKLPRKI